jgi:ligand-binding sensor domain-containing protein
MSFFRRLARAICCGLLIFTTLGVPGTATAVSWNYLNGPFGGQPVALFNDTAGNTWAGMNGSGVFFRAAGTTSWILRPGLPSQGNNAFAMGGSGTVYVTGSAGVYAFPVGGTAWQQVSGSNGLPGQAGGGITSDAQGAVYVGMSLGGVYKLGSGATTWASVGTGLPAGSPVFDLVFDGTGNLWASVYGTGVYKLPAGGGTWSAMNTALGSLEVNALAVVGNDLFAGAQFHGVFKLANASGGGSTWAAWNGGSLGSLDAVYDFARGAGNILYAAGFGLVYALPAGSHTWSVVGGSIASNIPTYSIVYSSIDGALTIGNGTGILVLPAGGSTWQAANGGMTASTIYGLAVAGNGDLYAATFGQGVQRLPSGSSTWAAVDPAHTSSVIDAIAINSVGTIFATSGSDVVKLAGGTWISAGAGLGGFAYSLAVDPANGLWAGQTGQVNRLPFGASTWMPVGSGLPSGINVNALAFDGSGNAYAGMYGTGVYTQPLGTLTWGIKNTGLTDLNVRVLQVDAGGTVFAGTDNGVFKLAGAWQRVGIEPLGAVFALAFDTNGDLYAGVADGFVWRLPAGGTTWSQLGIGFGSRNVSALVVGGGHIYAGTAASGGSPSGVYVFVPLATVVEFYNDLLDNFFITATLDEQNAVTNGAAGPGWSRTGDFFNAGGLSLVCRFYGSLSPGPNSHFYTIDPAECQSLKDLQATTPITEKRWNFESNDFASSITTGGQCANGLVSVYRAYNNGFTRGVDSNHRITANHAAYLAQIAKGWIGEGVVMCAPAK